MCMVSANGNRIEAISYFTEAKKKIKQLKKLKSVSRAYRKAAVKEIKMRAFRRMTNE
jgi:hypothetical protein